MWITEQEVRVKLRVMCEQDTQTRVAERLGCSVQLINDVIHGRRNISKGIARKLGYEIKVVKTVDREYKLVNVIEPAEKGFVAEDILL